MPISFAPVFFVGILVLVFGGAVVLSRRQCAKARRNLAALAGALGLQLHEKPPVLGLFPLVPTVDGRYRERPIRFYTFTTGSGKQRQTWQAVGLACENRHGLSLGLVTQGFLLTLATRLGAQDLQVGDAAFDSRFIVRSNDAEFIRAALLPEVRAALLGAWSPRAMGAHLKLEGGEVVYAERGSFADAGMVERMKALLEPLALVATLPEVYRT